MSTPASDDIERSKAVAARKLPNNVTQFKEIKSSEFELVKHNVSFFFLSAGNGKSDFLVEKLTFPFEKYRFYGRNRISPRTAYFCHKNIKID